MVIGKQEFIGTKEAALILGYEQAYLRVLCSGEKFRKKVDAQKFAGRWAFRKSKIIEYGKEKGRINNVE